MGKHGFQWVRNVFHWVKRVNTGWNGLENSVKLGKIRPNCNTTRRNPMKTHQMGYNGFQNGFNRVWMVELGLKMGWLSGYGWSTGLTGLEWIGMGYHEWNWLRVASNRLQWVNVGAKWVKTRCIRLWVYLERNDFTTFHRAERFFLSFLLSLLLFIYLTKKRMRSVGVAFFCFHLLVRCLFFLFDLI